MSKYSADYSLITDIAISKRHPENSLVFPGPRRIEGDPDLVRLATDLAAECDGIQAPEFTLQHDNIWWRGHLDPSVVDGIWYRLRQQPSIPPRLENLQVTLAPAIMDILLHENLANGGLLLVTGGPGSGKTTTASSIVVSRLHKFGGMAYTVEDPPEHPLNGWHGEGYCAQTRVEEAEADPEAWSKAIRGALRSQAAKTPTILFIGEIRDDAAALAALRGAAQGFLVVATSFATDLISGISNFASRVTEVNYSDLGSLLRVVLYQQLREDILTCKVMVIHDGSPSAIYIRKGQFPMLQNELTSQSNLLLVGRDLMKLAA